MIYCAEMFPNTYTKVSTAAELRRSDLLISSTRVEFKKARHAVSCVSLDTPENIYRRENVSWAATTLKAIAGDFTMVKSISGTCPGFALKHLTVIPRFPCNIRLPSSEHGPFHYYPPCRTDPPSMF